MRPVNLIPAEQRRDGQTKTGGKVYLVLAGLALILVAVILVVTTGNAISDRKAQKVELQSEKSSLEAQTSALAQYASFAELEHARQGTVVSLAHSRFDWERVIRELALVLPKDVWLTQVTGTVSPAISVGSGGGDALRGAVSAPALQITGCGRNQSSVARLVAALHEIDGVTRVGVSKSERSGASDAGTTAADAGPTNASGGGAGNGDCRTNDTIARFDVTVAFDNAPTAAPSATPSAGAPATPAPVAPAATSTTAAPAAANSVGDAQQQQAQASQATATATTKAQAAAQIVPGQ